MATAKFHHRSSSRPQKPYKKISKRKTKQKAAVLKKPVNGIAQNAKILALSGSQKVNRLRQMRKTKIKKTLDSRREKASVPKLCVMVPLSELSLVSFGSGHVIIESAESAQQKIGKKPTHLRILHLNKNSNLEYILDLAKVAQILIFSLKSTGKLSDLANKLKSPVFAQNFSSLSRALAAQGVPTVLALLDLNEAPSEPDKRAMAKFVNAYFKSGLGISVRTEFQSDKTKLLHILGSIEPREIQWRDSRWHLLAENISLGTENGQICIAGYLKGNHPIGPNDFAHITGAGDYKISKVESLIVDPSGDGENQHRSAKKDVFGNEVASEVVFPLNDDFSDKTMEPLLNTPSVEGGTDEEEDICEIKKKLLIEDAECADRNFYIQQNEPDLPNEKKTPVDVPARLRFRKYRGLESLRSSPWKAPELPSAQRKLDFIKDYRARASAVGRKKAKALSEFGAVRPWQPVTITLKATSGTAEAVKALAALWECKAPVLVSQIRPDEEKRSVVHLKLKKVENADDLSSKGEYSFQCGFRRYSGRPLFSNAVEGSDKFLFKKKMTEKGYSTASFLGFVNFGKEPALVSRFGDWRNLLAFGEFECVDANRLIIKKILLTGYPVKCNKNKATVRYMFFGPLDITYFSSVELHSKLGLTGRIKDSVGTHGLMKCVFSDYVQTNDIVCMPLYRRVYPLLR